MISYRTEGSITVMMSMILLMLMSLFFSMVEGIRLFDYHMQAKMIASKICADAFSEYDVYLWNNYGVLGLDGGYGSSDGDVSKVESRMLEFAGKVKNQEVSGVNITEYGLLTDNKGKPFIKECALAAEAIAIEGAAAKIRDEVVAIDGMAVEDLDIDSAVDQGSKAIEESKKKAEELNKQKLEYGNEQTIVGDNNSSQGDKGEILETAAEMPQASEPVSRENNPFEIYKKYKDSGLLGLVIGDSEISQKVMTKEGLVSKRELRQGNTSEVVETNIMDEALYLWYLGEKCNRYGDIKSDRCLDYEMEYIVSGKASDKENLEGVVWRLLGIREVCNLATIMSNSKMMEEASIMAVTLAGATAMPPVIEAVKIAIILIWALVESVLDVRALLKGDKVAFIKTESQWESSLSNLGAAVSGNSKAKSADNGMSYKQYLYAFIFMNSEENKAYRPMDLIELGINSREGYEGVRMDNMIYKMNIEINSVGNPMFASFMTLGNLENDLYKSKAAGDISYITAMI
ncbi:MAG: DUF5702 domain-containing protein [Lachnospiraceae bacterium]|nr:DUF5702 domain-containing protein [Lachnospiraceae bacterium]